MKIYKWMLILMVGFTGSKTYSQEKKNTVMGEIVMSEEALESLLTKIAEQRKETLKKNQLLLLPAYQPLKVATYQDPRTYQDMRSLEYKLDLLLLRGNLFPTQGGTTTLHLPPQVTSMVDREAMPDRVNKKAVKAVEVLKGHQVFFANNSIMITAFDKQIIQGLIPIIMERQNEVLVVLNGYASAVGNAFYNNQLSYNRADAIKQLLVRNGVSPGNIMILYHGSDTTVREDEARRVEITLKIFAINSGEGEL